MNEYKIRIESLDPRDDRHFDWIVVDEDLGILKVVNWQKTQSRMRNLYKDNDFPTENLKAQTHIDKYTIEEKEFDVSI